ncbi:hypothetical protein F0562_033014 [Nyssa sinensis]|uniref:At1g61320/AtMIF1 LRR domain-containing protein n=1 Tax=Nyssa sinensis TaxID=561372 RepID=A0A5J5ARG2_9ASTE|nr:hypothetical protein F0562_033014 [Nyssa sinensis]
MPLRNVPRLSAVSFGGSYCEFLIQNFEQLSSYLSQLESLMLDFDYPNLVRYPNFPTLSNLRQLELKVYVHYGDSLFYCTSLIKASPLLYKFVLQLLWSENPLGRNRRIQKVKTHPYCCLKVVELIGFVGCATDIGLAKYLLKNASSLEKIIIKPLPRMDCMKLEKVTARERARQLRADLPPGAELVIL